MMKILSYPKCILACLLLPVTTVVISLLMLLASVLKNPIKAHDFLLNIWIDSILLSFNIKVDVTGHENIPNEGTIFLFNHSSLFDIPIVMRALRNRGARFGAKAELFKVPFLSLGMRMLGTLKIERSSRDKVLQLYRESLKNLDHGYNYILAPEGTRVIDRKLGKFKSGPFVMAIAGQAPLTPVVISGAKEILPKGSLVPCWGVWQAQTSVKILPPTPTKGLSLDQRPELQNKIYQQMSEALERG